MAHFDDSSGVVSCGTNWGRWWQTMDDVCMELDLEEGTPAKLVHCEIKPKHIKVVVKGQCLVEGEFTEAIQADDSIWTVEDKKLLRICLPKALSGADRCWKSLLKGQYTVDPLTFDKMEQKLTLQRYQYENPGMDFSGAEISGNYHQGGPKLLDR